MTDIVLTSIDLGIATITLNRPELRNPISDIDMIEALVSAIGRINADFSVRCAILTGAGSAFSSGGNLRKMGLPGELGGGAPADTPGGYIRGIQRIPLAFERLEVPIIAAVNGPAVGAGCDLACMCDIRVAGRSARFAESFIKLGLVPGDGGAWLLQRIIGYANATELSLTGDAIDADHALKLGLVSYVVEDTELLAATRELAERIARNPPHAVRMTKRLLIQARDSQLSHHLEAAAAYQALAHTTADTREAIAAFREKRKPVFVGR
jgi:enoyl-CoA hydratase/carnithine racemase